MGQWIFGKGNFLSATDNSKKLLKSSGCIVSDFAESGSLADAGFVLCTFEAVPIAFHGVSTLNNMVFSKALWENLLSNKYLKTAMENRSHWGEASHADRDEVLLSEAACRVNKFWIADNNLVLGNVDILNTTKGRDCYILAKVGRIGISSRGFGELRDRGDGLKDVVPEEYMHVSFDLVSFPAVPDATFTLITGDKPLPDTETIGLSAELRNLINQAYDMNPENEALRKLYQSAGGLTKKSFNFKDQDWLCNEVKKTMLSAEYSYTALRVAEKRARLESAKAIKSAGTRSSVVEEFDKDLRSANPDLRWVLKGVKPPDNGWYRLSYSYRHKFEFNLKPRVFMVRKGKDGLIEVMEG